ncbi:MAG: hypothetical protein PHS24_03380 [Bacilli bacterium]|nr:hypothetical protein [Bacilli bacterium]
MSYKCKICGFIHEGAIPDGYYCPICKTTLFDFEKIEEEPRKNNKEKKKSE